MNLKKRAKTVSFCALFNIPSINMDRTRVIPFFSFSVHASFVCISLQATKLAKTGNELPEFYPCLYEGMLKRAPSDTVLVRFFKFTGGTSQVHLRHHCDAPGPKNHFNRRLQHRSSQEGRLHMRTRLYPGGNEILPLSSCSKDTNAHLRQIFVAQTCA